MLHDVGYRISSSSDLSTSAITDICSGGHRITLQRRGNIFLGPRGPLLLPSVGWYVRLPVGENFFSPSYPPSLPSLRVIPVIPGIGKKSSSRDGRGNRSNHFLDPLPLWKGWGGSKICALPRGLKKKSIQQLYFPLKMLYQTTLNNTFLNIHITAW